MKTGRDVRDAILMLVDACNDSQVRTLAMSSAIAEIQLLPPEQRAKLTRFEVQTEVLNAYKQAQTVVAQQAKQVKRALKGSGPFLKPLIKFANRHHLDQEIKLLQTLRLGSDLDTNLSSGKNQLISRPRKRRAGHGRPTT